MNQTYAVSSVNFVIECEDNLLGKKVVSAIDSFFFATKEYSVPDKHSISLRFQSNSDPFLLPAAVRELSGYPSVRVVRDGNHCYLLKGNTVFHLDLAESSGTGFLDSTFCEMEPKGRQELLMLSLLWLMRKHGLYGLHGNALAKDGCGMILVGNTCSGKSTTALSLIRNGWQYLSDDVALLRQSQDIVEVIAFLKGFSFDPKLASRYPELEKSLKNSSSNGQKRFLDLSLMYPDSQVSRCIPNVLIFPRIVPQERSQLVPLNKATALIQLSQNSGGSMVDKEMVSQQIKVLKKLVYQASTYQLLAGRDLYEEPDKIFFILPSECQC